MVKINRPTGKAGKPQAFGFAEFEDPEVVLRCLKCLHGVELPDITPQGRQQGTKKKLVVRIVSLLSLALDHRPAKTNAEPTEIADTGQSG